MNREVHAGICGSPGLKCPGLPDRPKRRAQDAIAEIHHFGTRGYRWVLDADIEAWAVSSGECISSFH